MGCWGPLLYQNDLSEYVRVYYKEQLAEGRESASITQELISNTLRGCDEGDKIVFWLALADTQWDLGRLEDKVRKHALKYLEMNGDVALWELENPQDAQIRKKVLFELKNKLMSKQPTRKKIANYKKDSFEWKIGDVYAYQLDSEYAKEKRVYDRYLMFHKIGEIDCQQKNTIPIVRVKITPSNKLPLDEEMFNNMEYIQIAATNYEDRFLPFDMSKTIEEQIEEKARKAYVQDAFGFLPQFRMCILHTSKSIISEKLIYLGNFQNVNPPQIEFVPHDNLGIQSFSWKFLDKTIIDRYCGYNLRQYKSYQVVNEEKMKI